MSQREPFEYIEIDVDYCSHVYGTGDCAAILGTTGVRKCFNMFAGCQDQESFNNTPLTLRFCKPVERVPQSPLFFPALISASATTSTVNIGGTDSKLSALGRRGTITVRINDFAYHDRALDKYQSERISGDAQTDEGGYNPADRGTFFTKLRARWPYYAKRPIRHVVGYIDGGTLTIMKTRHFIITEMLFDAKSSGGNEVTFKGRDILDLADNKKAVCPLPSSGQILTDIAVDATSLTLSPEGIGDDGYPASGVAAIGSELVRFTRDGDAVTLTERGARGSKAASHSADDAFQLSYSIRKKRVDAVIKELLVDYASVPESFIPDADWAAEVDRWGGSLLLTTDIPKPEGVAGLVGELAILGVSIWWDDVNQKIRLKMIRPVDGDTVHVLTDDNAIKSIKIEDRDDDRLTEVAFNYVAVDPTNSRTRSENYARQRYLLDLLSKSPNAYGDTKIGDFFMRWLNHGDDRAVRTAGRRILQRLKTPPKRYTIKLDAKDDAIALTDVLNVTSRLASDDTGKAESRLLQVTSRTDPIAGHEIEVTAQSYIYDGRFGFITPNVYPDYDDATDAQKVGGAFIVGDTLTFADGGTAYEII